VNPGLWDKESLWKGRKIRYVASNSAENTPESGLDEKSVNQPKVKKSGDEEMRGSNPPLERLNPPAMVLRRDEQMGSLITKIKCHKKNRTEKDTRGHNAEREGELKKRKSGPSAHLAG